MATPLRVLIAEDSENDVMIIMRQLRLGGYEPLFYEQVDTAEAMRAALTAASWDIIIADYSMPRFNGLAALKLLQETGQDLPFLVVSGSIGEELAVAAMKAGVHDCIMKNNMSRLLPAVERELREAKNRHARRQAEEQLKASLQEKEILLQEVHHRVKNTLQVITSILNLQSQYVKDEHALRQFKESQSRIRSISLVHEKLYRSKDLVRIDFSDYVQEITTHLFHLYGKRATVGLEVDIGELSMHVSTAIPCGIIINELVSNALKYAFPDDRNGRICIRLREDQDRQYVLTVSDNGIGFPKDLDFHNTETLGLQLVVTLTGQLGGTIQRHDGKEGTAFAIKFPEQGY
jgi:two-component sensor histidine kinase